MKNELFSVQELEARFEMEVFPGATLDCGDHTCCEDYSCSISVV